MANPMFPRPMNPVRMAPPLDMAKGLRRSPIFGTVPPNDGKLVNSGPRGLDSHAPPIGGDLLEVGMWCGHPSHSPIARNWWFLLRLALMDMSTRD